MTYRVGQVIYVLNNESSQVIPIQVVEQVTRVTLDGEKISYMINVPHNRGEVSKPAPLEKVKGEIFDSLAEAREHLRKNALRAVESIVKKAQKMAEVSFGTVESDDPVSAVIGRSDKKEAKETPKGDDDDSNVVVLPDGTKARVKIPDSVESALVKPVQKGTTL